MLNANEKRIGPVPPVALARRLSRALVSQVPAAVEASGP